MIITGITVAQFEHAVALAGRNYADNLRAEIGREYSNTRFNARVMLRTTGYKMGLPTDALAPGQRRSASVISGQRRINAVCWHAYRDVLVHVFHLSPKAKVRTAYAKYIGAEGFLANYPQTAHINIGSMMYPVGPAELCDCYDAGVPVDLSQPETQPIPMVSNEEKEMIEWWAEQSKRALARS